ncbi:flexible cuticle protein 12-like [Diorhabda carinulata]|uniref:flexible cuticle protein 12-like n=1 Tax=Diorhabda carinulata TaxID=1163345 RepID=UPI0025A2B33F|nr:flexible cuticle protein 12-like [Diorhabda carinulata]
MLFVRSFVIVGALVVYCVEARPADGDAQAQIVKFNNDVRLDGYNFDFETSNGIKRQESGVVKPGATPDDALLTVDGDFSYTLPDGTPVSVTFEASENGYRPKVVIGQPRSGKR